MLMLARPGWVMVPVTAIMIFLVLNSVWGGSQSLLTLVVLFIAAILLNAIAIVGPRAIIV